MSVLLRECPGLRLLLSTRELLEDPSEKEVSIGKLDERYTREVFSSVAGDRLSEEDKRSQDFSRIIEWLDGHPLSLMLVARQAGTVSLARLRQRLQEKGADAVVESAMLGEEPPPDADAELRLMRLTSSLNLSFLPLREKSPATAEMFAWLGHFPAGLPGVLVPQVFGDEGEDDRAELLRTHLAEEVGRERRLALPTPVRAYARVRATELPETRKVALSIASFGALAGWLDALYKELGKPRAREAITQGAREETNLAALLSSMREVPASSISGEQADALASRMAAAIQRLAAIMLYAGVGSAAISVANQVLSQIKALPLTSGEPEAGALSALGDLCQRTDRLTDAENAYALALTLFKDIDNRLGQANTHESLGDLYLRTNRLTDAENAYALALNLFEDIDDRLGQANTHKALGDLYLRTHRLPDAENAYALALTLFKDIDDRLGQANTLGSMGMLNLARGDRTGAFEQQRESIELHRALGNSLGVAAAQVYLAHTSLAAGRPLRVVALLRPAIEFFASQNDHFDLILAYQTLLPALHQVGKEDPANAAAIAAWAHAAAIKHPFAQQMAQANSSDSPPSPEDLAEAEATLATALAECEEELARLGEDPYSPSPNDQPHPRPLRPPYCSSEHSRELSRGRRPRRLPSREDGARHNPHPRGRYRRFPPGQRKAAGPRYARRA